MKAGRVDKGLTQDALANLVGVSRTNYMAWEHGRKHPSAKSLKSLAEALGIPVGELTSTDRAQVTLRDLREWAGLSQADVAEHLGFATGSAWASIENGQTKLGEEHRRVLAGLLDSSDNELAEAWERSHLD